MSAEMLAKNDLVIDGGLKSLEICKRAGVKVGYGSDLLGALQVDQSREFLLRREVLSPIEIIRQATLVGAEIVRMEGKLGVIEAGAFADLMVVDGDPLKNLELLSGQGEHMLGDHEGRSLPQEPPFGMMSKGGPAVLAAGRASFVDSRRFGRIALIGAATLGYAVILTPIFFVCWLSFFENEIITFPPRGYTLRWFANIFDQNNFVGGFLPSLHVGIAAMIGGLVLGVPASLVLARHRFPGREALNTLLLLPLVVPGVVLGTAIYVFQIEVELATEWPLLGSRAGLVAGPHPDRDSLDRAPGHGEPRRLRPLRRGSRAESRRNAAAGVSGG